MPDYFIWIQYISWFNYTYDALIIVLWQGVGCITCATGGGNCCTTGQEILNQFNSKSVIDIQLLDYINMQLKRILKFF